VKRTERRSIAVRLADQVQYEGLVDDVKTDRMMLGYVKNKDSEF
jgi:hypothetical protein